VVEVVVQKTMQEVPHNHYQLKVEMVVEVMDQLMILDKLHNLVVQILVVVAEVEVLQVEDVVEMVVLALL
jgi:hypothetical protein